MRCPTIWVTSGTGSAGPTALATASIEHRGESGGVRATLDLLRGVHRALHGLIHVYQDGRALGRQGLMAIYMATNAPNLIEQWPPTALSREHDMHACGRRRLNGLPLWAGQGRTGQAAPPWPVPGRSRITPGPKPVWSNGLAQAGVRGRTRSDRHHTRRPFHKGNEAVGSAEWLKKIPKSFANPFRHAYGIVLSRIPNLCHA